MAAAKNPRRGSDCYNAKFSEADVRLVQNLIADRENRRKEAQRHEALARAHREAAAQLTNKRIAVKFEVHKNTIWSIANRERWIHVQPPEQRSLL